VSEVPGMQRKRPTVRRRIIAVFVLTVMVSFLLIGRLAWIQIVSADELYEKAWEQWNYNLPVKSERGVIYDCHGRLLVGNTAVDTVAAVPAHIENPGAVAEILAPLLGMDPAKIVDTITIEKSVVYIKRKVEPDISAVIREMNIPGIIFFKEEKRFYPGDNLASQLLGFVGTDQGWSGLEVHYDRYLNSKEGLLLFPADGKGRQLPHLFNRVIEPLAGFDLHLTIDETIQYVIEKELDWAMHEFAPRQIVAIAVNPHTGAVLGAASRPDFKPGQYYDYKPANWSLAPVTSSYEPGSTFKLVTLAAVVEEGFFYPDEIFYCSGHTTIGSETIHCWTHKRGGHGSISFYSALGHSCNTAYIELGKRLGRDKLFHYIDAFGFGKPTGIDYPGEASGLVFKPGQIGPLELATTSFGQGISVTPLQQVMAVAAIANGGNLFKPFFVEKVYDHQGHIIYFREPEMIRQVISHETAQIVSDMMVHVITDGTGRNAAVEGYTVAGKTGTAEQVGLESIYKTDDFIYSMVGFAPAEKPRVVLYLAIDGVTRGARLGTYTSAPLFSSIMEELLNYLQASPSDKTYIPEIGEITEPNQETDGLPAQDGEE